MVIFKVLESASYSRRFDDSEVHRGPSGFIHLYLFIHINREVLWEVLGVQYGVLVATENVLEFFKEVLFVIEKVLRVQGVVLVAIDNVKEVLQSSRGLQ